MVGLRLLKRVRYYITHMPVYLQNIMEQRSNLSVHYFGYGSNLILMVALALGLYTRWVFSQDMAVLLFAFLGLFVFSISCALVYYFSMKHFGFSLSRLWIGCLLGVISFTEQTKFKYETAEEAMNILLVSSIIVRAFWTILERCLHVQPNTSCLLSMLELLEMMGMAVAAFSLHHDYMSIMAVLCALATTLVAIRLRSYFGVINLILICVLSGVYIFPQIIKLDANPYALSCFVGRLAIEPLIDLYFSGLTALEKWHPIISLGPLKQRISILLVLCVETTLYAVCAQLMPSHKEWFVIVPIFGAFSLVWVCYHLFFIITLWQLSNKVTECNAYLNSLPAEDRNMHRIMAAKGVRHFSLMSQRLVAVAFVTTVIIGALAWTTKTGISVALWCTVMPLEAAVFGFLWELSNKLGGTCIGYAIVAPAVTPRKDSSATLLPGGTLQELSSRATHILNAIQRFFAFHLIDNYGCDYSSSGLTAESIESKLRAFFQKVTNDGPKFDTYLVFYSGPVLENGNWALADQESLSQEKILEWWKEYNETSGVRLILVLDTKHSNLWIREMRRQRDVFAAVQSCYIIPSYDAEVGPTAGIGDFTMDWVSYNCANTQEVDWKQKDRMIKALYGVSKHWTDFTFHLPTEHDIAQHWDSSFPKITKPLIKLTNFPQVGQLFCCCDCIIKCMKRKKMKWLPPHELDTGHGFKLIRS